MTSKSVVDNSLLVEHAEDLYEHAPCGYISTLEDGTIVKVNQTLLAWLGYERSELIQGKRFQELLSIGGRIFFETHLAPLLKMQGFANEINFDLLSKNRQQIPVLTSTIQRRRSDGSAIFNRTTVFNITDRKKYERELLLARKKAEKAARAKADFLSMMSHEIRTPMNAVLGIATLLERTQLSEQQREYISMLKTSSENLMNLLNSILDFSKIEAGKISIEERNFKLRKLIDDATRGLEGQAQEKGLSLRINIQDEVPQFVIGDPVKIAQVITNFVGNAIKFTEKGSISVNVLSLGSTETSASVRFEVSDTGIGISPDRLPRIFDEFTQADYEIGMKYGGSGLGLAISNKLVEIHGSKINVESQLGQGSKFSFDLILKVGFEEAESTESHRCLEESGILTGLRVLIAEDNKANIYIVERLLRSWGVESEIAYSGQEVLDKVASKEFDLILMDLRMPVLNGYEATTRIRESEDERLKQIPVIAFSASTKIGEEDLVEITAFDDVIGKPFRSQDLFSKIAFYTGRSQTSFSALVNGSKIDEPSKPKTENAGFSELFTLDEYMESLDGDREAVAEILQLVLNSYSDAQTEIVDALITGDLAKFEFKVHRIRSSLEILRATPLKTALDRGREALITKSHTEEARATIEKSFVATIEGLRSFLGSAGD